MNGDDQAAIGHFPPIIAVTGDVVRWVTTWR